MAKVEPLPGIAWSPEAAINELNEAIKHKDVESLLVFWIDNAGDVQYRSSGMDNFEQAYLCSQHTFRMQCKDAGLLPSD